MRLTYNGPIKALKGLRCVSKSHDDDYFYCVKFADTVCEKWVVLPSEHFASDTDRVIFIGKHINYFNVTDLDFDRDNDKLFISFRTSDDEFQNNETIRMDCEAVVIVTRNNIETFKVGNWLHFTFEGRVFDGVYLLR